MSDGFFRSTIHIIRAVAADKEYLMIDMNNDSLAKLRKNLPCKDVLSVVIPQIDLWCPPNRLPLRLSIVALQ
jgi:hypothetical protein